MKLKVLALASCLTVAFGLSAQASCLPVLLTIDLSDPSNVTITATGAFAAEDSSATSAYDGIDLLQFFTGGVIEDPEIEGGLTPAGSSEAYNMWATDSYSGASVDMNLYYSDEGSDTQSFTTDSAAFTGSWTGLDLVSLYDDGFLPTFGATGDILAGYSGNSDGIIGEWVVVPEPSQYGWGIALAMAALIGYRRLRVVDKLA